MLHIAFQIIFIITLVGEKCITSLVFTTSNDDMICTGINVSIHAFDSIVENKRPPS